jgi:DNA primase
VEEVLEALAGYDIKERPGGGWVARCPAHDDGTPSLYISIGRAGQVLLYCHGGCKTEDVLAAAGLTFVDLYNGCGGCSKPRPKPPKVMAEEERVKRHAVYAAFLDGLPLEDSDQARLLRRGLRAEEIDRAGYRTLEEQAVYRAVDRIMETFRPDAVRGVPGFLVSRRRGYVKAVEYQGIAIPVRDEKGRIIGLQVRKRRGRGAKYRWFAAAGQDTTWPHAPIGTPCPAPVVRVTEGPLKADVVTALDPDRVPTIAVAGVACWRDAVPLLEAFDPFTVRLAFDADAHFGPGRRHVDDFCQELGRLGYRVEIERWHEYEGKGLDDLLANGHRPRVSLLRSS